MMNAIWVFMVIVAVICGAITGQLDAVAKATTDSAKAAVTLAIGLVGVMAFWLGMMRILQKGGLLEAMARGLRPIMKRLFPEIPDDHPAMGMMILNVSANMLGMANAATPFGIKAMNELNKLNSRPGYATNSMALFLAINTSGLAVLPTGMIAIRASLGSHAAGSILVPTLMATMTATTVAICMALWLQTWGRYRQEGGVAVASTEALSESDKSEIEEVLSSEAQEISSNKRMLLWGVVALIVMAFGYAFYKNATSLDAVLQPMGYGYAAKQAIQQWPLVILIVGFIMFGLFKGINIYEAVVEGGKEGFDVALRIIPFLVGILVAVGMLRASGAIDLMVTALGPITALIGMPAEVLPMALLRPLSGSGAFAVSSEIMQTYGPDSIIGNIVSTMQGSTETTFYVLAVYYGAVSIKHTRHTLPVCLAADTAGILMAVWACNALL